MSRTVKMRFRLYIAGDAPNSVQAVANPQPICQGYLPGRPEIEVVDVVCHPRKALDYGVLLTPTVGKLFPRVVGNLSDRTAVVEAFGLPRATA